MDPRTLRDRYLTDLDRNPRLTVAARRELVNALGPLEYEGPQLRATNSLRARVELEAQCVRAVLPRWTAYWEDYTGPSDLLHWTQLFLDGEIPGRQLKVLAGRVFTAAEEREAEEEWPARVGIAAAAVARVARHGNVIADYADDERQMDLEDWDAGVLCGAISVDGPPWEDPSKFHDYWRWYLTDAYERALLVAKMSA